MKKRISISVKKIVKHEKIAWK